MWQGAQPQKKGFRVHCKGGEPFKQKRQGRRKEGLVKVEKRSEGEVHGRGLCPDLEAKKTRQSDKK